MQIADMSSELRKRWQEWSNASSQWMLKLEIHYKGTDPDSVNAKKSIGTMKNIVKMGDETVGHDTAATAQELRDMAKLTDSHLTITENAHRDLVSLSKNIPELNSLAVSAEQARSALQQHSSTIGIQTQGQPYTPPPPAGGGQTTDDRLFWLKGASSYTLEVSALLLDSPLLGSNRSLLEGTRGHLDENKVTTLVDEWKNALQSLIKGADDPASLGQQNTIGVLLFVYNQLDTLYTNLIATTTPEEAFVV